MTSDKQMNAAAQTFRLSFEIDIVQQLLAAWALISSSSLVQVFINFISKDAGRSEIDWISLHFSLSF